MTNLEQKKKKKFHLTDLQTISGGDKNILPLFSDMYSFPTNASQFC